MPENLRGGFLLTLYIYNDASDFNLNLDCIIIIIIIIKTA